jgi:triacylglycerol esterase/lipase EstA (alpha/beta hydrolase family)
MKNIYAIHGAFSSPAIFAFMQEKLKKGFNWHFLDYHAEIQGIVDIVNSSRITTPCHVIGHSMGGLIALGLISNINVLSVTTIACPLGGIEINSMQKWYGKTSFVNDIVNTGTFIKQIKDIKTTKPVQHLISCVGFNPWIYEPNDGVLTLRSQRAYTLGKTHDIQANHVEIMMNESVIDILKNFWN